MDQYVIIIDKTIIFENGTGCIKCKFKKTSDAQKMFKLLKQSINLEMEINKQSELSVD